MDSRHAQQPCAAAMCNSRRHAPPLQACSQRDLKEHFSTYVEDFNTATLPDEKYYNLRTWYLKEQARKAREGADAQAPPPRSSGHVHDMSTTRPRHVHDTVHTRPRHAHDTSTTCPQASAAATFERTTFDDEAARKAELARERAKRSEATTALMAKAMGESKGSSALMEDMRQQEEARRLMQARGRDRNRWGKESAGSCSQGKENVRGALPALTPASPRHVSLDR